MAVEEDFTSIEKVEKYINKRVSANVSEEKNNEKKVSTEKFDNIEEIEIRINPKSHQVNALKASVKIDSHILNMTIDTGSPVSLLNWATTKQILEGPTNSKFIPAEKLNLSAQFVDYNKRPILILGALKANLRSAGWEVLQKDVCDAYLVWIFKVNWEFRPLKNQLRHENPGLTCYCASSQKVGSKNSIKNLKISLIDKGSQRIIR